ncbi:hypothetical protein Tco_1555240 [Tanacetum coccineum]
MFFRRSVRTRCKGYIGDFVFWDVMLKDMVALYVGNHALPSSDYVPGPEEPLAPLPLDFVPEPIYTKFMPVEDESDPEEDPEEDDEDPEEDLADYPDEDEDKEEEDHPTLADSVLPVHRMTARISIRAKPSISLPPREEVEKLLALTTPPPSPLTLLSSPLPHIPSPPLPVPPPTPPLLPIPAPILSPPVILPSIDRRADRPEVCLPPRKWLCFTHGPRYEVGESSSAAAARPTGGGRADYRFVGTMDDAIRRRRAEEVGYRIRDAWVDLREAAKEDTQDRQTQMYQRVKALVEDRQYRYETARLLDQEALVSREACGRSMEESDCDFRDGSIMDSRPYLTGAACADFDIDAVTTGTCDYSTGTGDSTARIAGTLWRSKIAGCIGGGRKMAPKRKTRSTPETTTTTTSVTNAQLQVMIDQGVTDALAARNATRNSNDSHTSRTGVRRTKRVARECTYQDFMKCQPLYFKGTEGVVELTQWFERMETVFRISNCFVDNQIKFSTCTLLAGAMTWWNSHVRIVGQDVAYTMT